MPKKEKNKSIFFGIHIKMLLFNQLVPFKIYSASREQTAGPFLLGQEPLALTGASQSP